MTTTRLSNVRTESTRSSSKLLSVATVSIGMPVWNSSLTVAQAIMSILSQTYSDFELLISDNSSTDGTQEICRSFASRDSRVKVFSQPTNVGALQNFNFVLTQASGRYFMWAAGDDFRSPDSLASLVTTLEKHPQLSGAFGLARLVDEDEDRVEDAREEGSLQLMGALRSPIGNAIVFHKFPSIPLAFYGLFRRDRLEGLNPSFSGQLRYLEGHETPFLAAVSLRGPIVQIPTTFLTYSFGSNWNLETLNKRALMANLTRIMVGQVLGSNLRAIHKAVVITVVLVHHTLTVPVYALRKKYSHVIDFLPRYLRQVQKVGFVPIRFRKSVSSLR